MIYYSPFTRDLFAEMNRLQDEMQQMFSPMASIRGQSRGFPAINIGSTPTSIEIYAFVPGVEPGSIDAQIEKNVLTISGSRNAETLPEKSTAHIGERYAGPFRRVVSLPDDVDANAVRATYRDGVLHISIARKQAAQPRRISIE